MFNRKAINGFCVGLVSFAVVWTFIDVIYRINN